jgi:hypothetical protein
MRGSLSQDPGDAVSGRRPHPRRVRVAEAVYQRVDRRSGQPVPGKFEFTYRDATGRQVWQTAKGETKAAARPSGPRRWPASTGEHGSSEPS